jgi:peptide/nickel transport system ATP-binding protein
LIADEPTTALDAMVQAQILDLLDEQQKQNGMSILLITHNLGIVAQRADDVGVMYASRIVEVGDSQRLFAEPLHPYTRGLLESLLRPGFSGKCLRTIPGAVPEPLHFPAGCKFHPRCPTGYKDKRCQTFEPELKEVQDGRCVACWYAPGYERDASCVMRRASYAIRTTKYALRNDIMNQPMTNIDGYLLKVNNLKTYFPIKRGLLRRTVGYVKAVDGISFGIRAGRSPAPDRARLRRAGQTLGLVGESGCGKTTVARSIVRLVPATAGEVVFDGIDVLSAGKNKLRQIRRQIGLIFQDPYSSLNPRMTIGDIVSEPLKVQSHWGHQVVGWKNGDVRERVAVLLSKVGLSPEHINRYPHEFSGGQRQRIGVARALALEPKLVICDEPVSSLDVSIQSQILNLLKDLQQELGLTYLFIAHDLAVVEFFCDIVAVMYMGKIVEQAEAEELYRNPLHPYTQALMSAIPRVEPSLRGRRSVLGGEAPSILSPPNPDTIHRGRTGPSAGCAFHSRCPLADGDCLKQTSVLEEKSKGHFVACWKCKKIDY